MKKRGFTLIELLAVIVVLAIIALIATPIVMNVINDAKKGSAEASARLIGSVGRTHYVNNIMKNEELGTIDLSKDILKYDGEQAKKGYIEFDEKGNTSGKMYIGGYCITLNSDNSVSSEKISEDECEIEMPNSTPTGLTYTDGTPFYFNPTTGLACNPEDAVSTYGTKSGCMKFYAFLTSEEDENVKLLLDHNTSYAIRWSSNANLTIGDKVNQMVADNTTGWKQVVNGVESELTARLISATEVNQIAPKPYGEAWNINDPDTHYNFNGEKYTWLFNNTKWCSEWGCTIEDNNAPEGYWTSDYAGDGMAWCIIYEGKLGVTDIINSDQNGVRPVIEVSKKVFE